MNEIETLEAQQKELIAEIKSREDEVKKLYKRLTVINKSLKIKTKGKNIDFRAEIIRVALEEGPRNKHELVDRLVQLHPNRVRGSINVQVYNVITSGFLKTDTDYTLIKGREIADTKINRRGDIIRAIRESEKPLSAADIGELIGVDAVAIRIHLLRLIRANAVVRTQPPHLRKGAYVYSLPEHANV